jgi:hypothetical protein
MFFAQCEIVFAANCSLYTTDESRILYAISNMTGMAFKFFEPYMTYLAKPLEQRPTLLTNYSIFVETVTKSFGDSNPVINAKSAIRHLKQTGPVSVYATEFRRISMFLKWNDEALMSQYKLNLKEFVILELARRPPCTSLTDLIAESIEVDNLFYTTERHIKDNHQSKYPNRHNQNRNQNHNQNRNQNRNQNNRNHVIPERNHHQNQASSFTSSPMDLSATVFQSNKPRGISEKEKQYRVDNRLCLYCGGNDHYRKDCPHKPSNPPRDPPRRHESVRAVILDNKNHAINNDQELHINTVFSTNVFIGHLADVPFHPSDILEDAYSRNIMHNGHEDQLRYRPADMIHFVTQSVNSKAIILPIQLSNSDGQVVYTSALVDCGATSSFISSDFLRTCSIGFTSQPIEPLSFTMADRFQGIVINESQAYMTITGTHHKELITLKEMDQGSFPVILGMPEVVSNHRNI